MNPDESLPPELAELERRLRRRNGQDESVAMRDRVLDAVRRELSQGHRIPTAMFDGWWLAGIAAAVLIVMNLSITTTSVPPHFEHAMNTVNLAHESKLIRATIPDLSEADANRLILYSMSAREFPLVPNFGPIEKGTLP